MYCLLQLTRVRTVVETDFKVSVGGVFHQHAFGTFGIECDLQKMRINDLS